MNGGTVLAMSGKNCFAIAADRSMRFNGSTLMSTHYNRIFKITDKIYLGMAGFSSDAERQVKDYRKVVKLFELREEREMHPEEFINMVGGTMYERRTSSPYYGSPIVVGLKDGVCYFAHYDSIGAHGLEHDFGVCGTSSQYLYGLSEKFWRPNMDKDELFATVTNVLTLANERDTISGNGMVVYLVTEEGCEVRKIETRMD